MSPSLEEVLAAREARAGLQAGLALRWASPVLSLTLVSPGPVKDDPLRRRLMDLAESALERALAQAGWKVLAGLRRDGPTGPESLRAVAAPALALKELAVGLEDSLPWGRLLDADVLVLAPGREAALPEPITRSALGLPPRPCLVCSHDARHCMAEGRHGRAELEARVEALLSLAGGLAPDS